MKRNLRRIKAVVRVRKLSIFSTVNDWLLGITPRKFAQWIIGASVSVYLLVAQVMPTRKDLIPALPVIRDLNVFNEEIVGARKANVAFLVLFCFGLGLLGVLAWLTARFVRHQIHVHGTRQRLTDRTGWTGLAAGDLVRWSCRSPGSLDATILSPDRTALPLLPQIGCAPQCLDQFCMSADAQLAAQLNTSEARQDKLILKLKLWSIDPISREPTSLGARELAIIAKDVRLLSVSRRGGNDAWLAFGIDGRLTVVSASELLDAHFYFETADTEGHTGKVIGAAIFNTTIFWLCESIVTTNAPSAGSVKHDVQTSRSLRVGDIVSRHGSSSKIQGPKRIDDWTSAEPNRLPVDLDIVQRADRAVLGCLFAPGPQSTTGEHRSSVIRYANLTNPGCSERWTLKSYFEIEESKIRFSNMRFVRDSNSRPEDPMRVILEHDRHLMLLSFDLNEQECDKSYYKSSLTGTAS